MSSAIAVGQRTERTPLSTLESLTVGILAGMVLVWITFQVVDLQALFPPIGILYALGSIAAAAAILLSRRHWSPALAAGWSVMMIPESIPAVEHLLDWNDFYTHFGHYLIIMTFFPLAIALVASGIGATVQNYNHEPQDRQAPDWLQSAILGVVTLVLVANAVTVALYAFHIP
jgi:hypothetical protein